MVTLVVLGGQCRDTLGSLVITHTQELLWGHSGGQFGGDLGLSLKVLWDHFWGILKMNLEVL